MARASAGQGSFADAVAGHTRTAMVRVSKDDRALEWARSWLASEAPDLVDLVDAPYVVRGLRDLHGTVAPAKVRAYLEGRTP